MSTVEPALGGPEIEVAAKATRRRFTLEYKRKIVREADGCKTPGAVGALLCREGLYSSQLATWPAARDCGELPGPAKKRGPTPQIQDPRDNRIAELERETARWRKRAERAEALVEVQKTRGVAGATARVRALLMSMVTEVGPRLGIAPTCAVLAVLHEPRFMNLAPAEVYATLLEEGRHLCSERTMCRILAAHDEVRERRNHLRHPPYTAPQLMAHQPNELWSWDITKLLGPAKWTYFYLYVMLDVFSRYVVGWMVAHRESATLAERFIRETCARQGIGRKQLMIHADRGPAMTSKPVALLLADLGVTKTHARLQLSNDHPSSEAQFMTLKYRPAFPERFGSIQYARAYCHGFFSWYNTERHHSSLGLLTPDDVHHGLAEQRVAARSTVLAAAYAAHPERFPAGLPRPPAPPTEVWINHPAARSTEIAP